MGEARARRGVQVQDPGASYNTFKCDETKKLNFADKEETSKNESHTPDWCLGNLPCPRGKWWRVWFLCWWKWSSRLSVALGSRHHFHRSLAVPPWED